MKYKSVKKASDVTLTGISVALDTVDNGLTAVTLTDEAGNVLRIAMRSYNLYIEVPAPPEMETKYKLAGNVLEIPVERLFDDEYTANQEKRRLENETSQTSLIVEKIEIPVAA